MPRIPAIPTETAPEASRPLLEQAAADLGRVPNLLRSLAHSPAALRAYLAQGHALAGGVLGERDRHRIALAVCGAEGCSYGLAAHSAVAAAQGLSDQEISDAKGGISPDRRSEALVGFARLLVEGRGRIEDADFSRLRQAGLDHGEITEAISVVALTQFTSLFTRVAATEIDFPPAPDAPHGAPRPELETQGGTP